MFHKAEIIGVEGPYPQRKDTTVPAPRPWIATEMHGTYEAYHEITVEVRCPPRCKAAKHHPKNCPLASIIKIESTLVISICRLLNIPKGALDVYDYGQLIGKTFVASGGSSDAVQKALEKLALRGKELAAMTKTNTATADWFTVEPAKGEMAKFYKNCIVINIPVSDAGTTKITSADIMRAAREHDAFEDNELDEEAGDDSCLVRFPGQQQESFIRDSLETVLRGKTK